MKEADAVYQYSDTAKSIRHDGERHSTFFCISDALNYLNVHLYMYTFVQLYQSIYSMYLVNVHNKCILLMQRLRGSKANYTAIVKKKVECPIEMLEVFLLK